MGTLKFVCLRRKPLLPLQPCFRAQAGQTALHWAARLGYMDIVRLLVVREISPSRVL